MTIQDEKSSVSVFFTLKYDCSKKTTTCSTHYANDLHCAFCNGVSDFTFFMGNFQRKSLFCDFSIRKWGINEWLLCNRDEWKLLLTSFFLPLMKKVLCTSFWQISNPTKYQRKKHMSKHRQPVTFWHVNQIDLIWENRQ